MPDWKRELADRLAQLGFTPGREAEVIDELSAHLDDRWRDLRASGTSRDEATRRVRAEITDAMLTQRLGALRQAQARDHVVPGAPPRRLLSDAWQDLTYARRGLLRQPGFAVAAVLTLALGIGVNTAIFTVVDATLLHRMPVADPDRLVHVYNGGRGGVFSYPAYASVRDRNEVLSGLLAWGSIQASVNAGDTVDLVEGAIVTGNYFQVLGIDAALGRVLQPADDVTPLAHPVVVISHRYWHTRFGAQPGVIGRRVLLNGQPFSVVGVLSPDFPDIRPGAIRDLFVPMMMQPVMRPPSGGYSGDQNPDLLNDPRSWLTAVGRLKPGVTLEQASAALTTAAAAMATSPEVLALPPGRRPPDFMTLAAFGNGNPAMQAQLLPVAALLHTIVGAILLMACANVANLLLSRSTARRREMALRLALGAGRWRLVRQLLTESALLAGLGGLLGVGVGWVLVRSFAAAVSGRLPLSIDLDVNGRVVFFTAGISMMTGLVFGLLPALRASRPSLVPSLKDGLDTHARRRRWAPVNVRQGLVVFQVTLSLVLLITAGLLVRSLGALEAVRPGFDVERLVSAPLSVNLLRYTRTQGREFYRRVIEDVSRLPGVDSVAMARIAVLGGSRRVLSAQVEGTAGTTGGTRVDGAGAGGTPPGSASGNVVTPGFFRTMGIPFVRGRDFAATDADGSPRVMVINDTMARVSFPGQEPIGRRVSITGSNGPWVEIVGIVRDSVYAALNEPPHSVIYLPLSQNHETGMTMYVRTSGEPARLIAPVRQLVQAIEPNLPLPHVQPLEATVGNVLVLARTAATFLAAFGTLALVLAAVGLYGVLAFSMNERRREFGVRVAMGATKGRVFRLVLREGIWLVTIGVVAGLAIAISAGRLLQTFLFGVSPADAATIAAVVLLLAAVGTLACVIPARRAMAVDPVTVLKGE
jgi:predicted permease